jgi:uncharacterized DUF497 family protein
MDFEYDAAKSQTNQFKHGIDFVQGSRLWQDRSLIILPSRYPDEERYLAVGVIDSLHWTAIFTERGQAIRIISVRRSRNQEKEIYERNKC